MIETSIRHRAGSRKSKPRIPVLLYAAAVISVLLSFVATPRANEQITLVAFGDSLSAGFDLAPEEAFPAQLEEALRARSHNVRVVNAGVSGDTTAAGFSRLDWAVPKDTDAVIVELGANDALRGLDPEQAKKNLDRIIAWFAAKNIKVLLAGMLAPRNLGAEYAARFDPIYSQLAEKHGVLLYPFFLQGVAGERTLNMPDGLHPSARGVAVIVENILPSVEKLLERVRTGKAG